MNVPTSTLVAGGIVPAGYCCCWVCSNIPRWGSVKHLPFMTWSVPHGSDYLRWGGSFRLGFYYSAGTAECFSVDLAPLPVAGWGREFLWIGSDRRQRIDARRLHVPSSQLDSSLRSQSVDNTHWLFGYIYPLGAPRSPRIPVSLLPINTFTSVAFPSLSSHTDSRSPWVWNLG